MEVFLQKSNVRKLEAYVFISVTVSLSQIADIPSTLTLPFSIT